MLAFSQAAIIGLFIGFLWGTGCSLAIIYSIYLGGYRRAVEDSLKDEKSKRWRETMKKIEAKRTQEAAAASK